MNEKDNVTFIRAVKHVVLVWWALQLTLLFDAFILTCWLFCVTGYSYLHIYFLIFKTFFFLLITEVSVV